MTLDTILGIYGIMKKTYTWWSRNFTLNYTSRDILMNVPKKAYTRIFIASLFMIVKKMEPNSISINY